MYTGTYDRLRVTVHASDREVIRRARQKMAPKARHHLAFRAMRKEFYREMLRIHHDARDLFRHYRF
jgi:hypothetical protein